jgi:RecA-family ATPase
MSSTYQTSFDNSQAEQAKDTDFQGESQDFILKELQNIAAIPYQKPEDPGNMPPPDDQDNQNWDSHILTGEFLLNSPLEKVPTLLDPIFPQKGLGALAGSSDTGKSTLLRQLGIAVATGAPSFCGHTLNTRHKSAIFALTEDDDSSMKFLLNKQNSGLGYPPEAYRNLRFIFNSENLIEKLERELRRQPADLVVIDAFSDLYDGEMNAGNKVRSFLNRFKERVADPFNCLVLILHHTGKKTDDNPPSKHNLIGSQAFEAKMRVVAELRKDPYDPSLRHLCIVKGNYLTSEYKDKSFELHFDENMIFRHTGERVAFEALCKTEQGQGQEDERLTKIALAFKMNREGSKLEDIASAVGVSGKGTVSKWLSNEKHRQIFG